MRIWLVSDTHFGHAMLVEEGHREFNYEQKVIDNIKAVVKPDDLLINLGDFAFKDPDHLWAKEWDTIDCKKMLVLGNHDKRTLTYYMEHFHTVVHTFTMMYASKYILFSHKPKCADKYSMNIFGHFHNGNHHLSEPALTEVLGAKHCMLSLEATKMRPVELGWLMGKFTADRFRKNEQTGYNIIEL